VKYVFGNLSPCGKSRVFGDIVIVYTVCALQLVMESTRLIKNAVDLKFEFIVTTLFWLFK
jgi:hypothetical protein